MDLSSNELDGDMPAFLQDLTHLEVLDLSRNKFTGRMPPSLGGLTRLWKLQLQDNFIGGPIPQDLGGCRRMVSSWVGCLFEEETLPCARHVPPPFLHAAVLF